MPTDNSDLEMHEDFANAFDDDEIPADDQGDVAPAEPAHDVEHEKVEDDSFAPDEGANDPAPAEEPATAATPQQEQDDVESLKKKAHGYDSMLGRLQSTQQELAQLKAQLAAQAPHPTAEQPAQAATPTAAIPDEIKDDYEALVKENPRVAALLQEDSAEGKRLRSALAEYGREYVEDKADNILTKRDLEAQIATVASHQQLAETERVRRTAYEIIGEKHPDFVASATARVNHAAYMEPIHQWVEGKPLKEARELLQVIERGTPQQIVGLLDQFKAETQKSEQPAAPAPNQRDQRAAAARAVPSRPSPMPRHEPSKDDFDAGWNMVPDTPKQGR